jgi:rhodanese-related sulfurtransferase|tara:strand:+ start:312 stop:623 length:312 start_codon:yes stop_codon:yes gene_type:complete
MNNLNQKEWIALMKDTEGSVLLDVRTEEEFESGYIEGAQLMNIKDPHEFMSSAQALDKSKSYFIYCRSGARSGQACQLLNQMGVKATYNLDGGILAWEGDLIT